MSDFKSFQNMCRKAAWVASKAYNVPYDEVESMAYEIFVEASNSWDATRNVGFGTHLTHQLRSLRSKCISWKNQISSGVKIRECSGCGFIYTKKSNICPSCGQNDNLLTHRLDCRPQIPLVSFVTSTGFEIDPPSPHYNEDTQEQLLASSKSELSFYAWTILCWIVKRDWEGTTERAKPTAGLAYKQLGLKRTVAYRAWAELHSWFNNKELI